MMGPLIKEDVQTARGSPLEGNVWFEITNS